jgi:hypothetical protein
MPFQSEAQRRYLWMKDPKIAEAWAHGKSSVTGKKDTEGPGRKGKTKNLPYHKRTSRKSKRS